MTNIFPRPLVGASLALALAATACQSVDVAPDPPAGKSTFEATDDPPRAFPSDGVPPAPPAPLDVFDVAILYPLPEHGKAGTLLRASEAGPHGPLLPKAAFAAFAPDGRLDEGAPSTYETLALVGVRVDTCYGGASCESVIRAVFQPVYTSATGDAEAGDAAIHVSYFATSEDVRKLAEAARSARLAANVELPKELGPHPALVAQGLDGAFATAFRATFFSLAGARFIERVTGYRHTVGKEHAYTFSSFLLTKGAFVAETVPSTNGLTQTVRGSSPYAPLEASHASLDTIPARDSVLDLVAEGRPAKGTPEAAALVDAFGAAVRIQNPDLHDSNRTDCASCHLAEGARRLGVAAYGFARDRDPVSDARRRDERTSVTNMHAFGYLGRNVCIMQRTATEAARMATPGRGIPF